MHQFSRQINISRLCHIKTILGNSASMNMSAAITKFPSENSKGDAEGVLVGDNTSTKGLIVVHEWWGMNEHIQKTGDTLGRQGGFKVLVPDFYRGKVAIDRETAGHLMHGLDWPGAVQDIIAAARFLKGQGCVKVGVTGFCMGGALSFAAAALCPDISAAAPFYGIPKPELADLTTIMIPVQAHFAEKDEVVGLSSPSDYEPLRERLEKAGLAMEWYTYDAPHAFANETTPNYHPEAAKLALGRMLQFMNTHLGN